jgi:hypothetical protein
MEQQFSGLNQWVSMEPSLNDVIVQQIQNSQQRHPLVVSHPLANRNSFAG